MTPRPHRLSLAALVGLLALALAAPAAAFDVRRHAVMTLHALRGSVAGGSLAATLHGSIYPDVSGCMLHSYCEGFHAGLTGVCRGIVTALRDPDEATITDLSGDHYDNNQLGMGLMRASYRIAKARRVLLEVSNPPTDGRELQRAAGAMVVFGAALHGIQDFYSHSTYLECNRGLVRASGLASVALWDGNRRMSCGSVGLEEGGTVTGLQTGFFLRSPATGETTHDALNKDTPEAPQGARALRTDARPRTQYAAVAGQFDGNDDIMDGYAAPGLAVRHTQRAFESLLGGSPLYGTRELPIVLNSRVNLISMRGDGDEAAHIQGVLDAMADDPRMRDMLQAVMAPSFAVCVVGEAIAEAFQRLLPASGD